MNRRVRAALLEGDAESTARPLARLGAGTYAGIFVTIALLAIVGIIGVLRPGGSTAWQQPGAFIVESETGARYVYLDGVLHPVLNYSSAKLLLGGRLHVVNVSVRSLESAPRGAAIGIGMAPDSLPDAGHVVGTDWSVCAIGETPRPAGTAAAHARCSPANWRTAPRWPPTRRTWCARTSGRNFLITSGHAFEIADQWLAGRRLPGGAGAAGRRRLRRGAAGRRTDRPAGGGGTGSARTPAARIGGPGHRRIDLRRPGERLLPDDPDRPGRAHPVAGRSCCWPIRGWPRPTAAATRRRCRSARRRSPAGRWRRCRTRAPASRRRPSLPR